MLIWLLLMFYTTGLIGYRVGCNKEEGDWILAIFWPVVAAMALGHWAASYGIKARASNHAD